MAANSKLGGVLTEVQAGRGAGVTVVTGIGLNIDLQEALELGVESDWAHRAIDLKSIHPDHPQREVIVAAMIGSLHVTMATFATQGFAAFVDEWRQSDWLQGREVTVDQEDHRVTGIARGVDADGALLVDTQTGPVRIISGSILIADANGQAS